jgi:hypothetical protein
MHMLGAKAFGHAGAIQGDIASAYHDGAPADGNLFAPVHIPHEFNAGQHPVTVRAIDRKPLSIVRPQGKKNSVKPIFKKPVQRFDAGVYRYFNTHLLYIANLSIEHVSWKAVFRNSVAHHASGGRQRLEYGYGMALIGQVVRRSQASRSGTDDGHSLPGGRLMLSVSFPESELVVSGSIAFEIPYRYRLVYQVPSARSFAGMIAYIAQNCREGDSFPYHGCRSGIILFTDAADIPWDIDFRRAGIFTRNQGILAVLPPDQLFFVHYRAGGTDFSAGAAKPATAFCKR